jgi:amino acid adenylation domain-containing protein
MSTAAMLTVTRQISEQAKLHPNAIALRCGDVDLSYGALEIRAHHFAEYLGRRGRVSGGAVAICMERSVDWIVAALAAMRAGAAYVPLDLTWPDARIRYAVEDSGAVAFVARTSTLERLQFALPGIDPSRDAAAIAEASGVMDCNASPESLAYVIYTSGSTGVPKGVEITHANLAHLVKWHREAFRVSPQDHASHLAGLGFDAAAWEIWPALCAGATVYIPDEAVRTSPDLVRSWMLRKGITIGFVPSLYAASMMEMEWPASTALRFLLTGGDVLHRGPSRPLPFDVVNNYGPTECTVVATSSILQAGASGAPPIGMPIAGTTVYLLDENRKEVPIGSPGEIYIGGNGVGCGYRNLPELTKERFVVDPFVTTPGARMYRTGDRGALRSDGQIQFLGRLDRQVKIRGNRLEMDEVGSVLSRHPSVSFAAVVASSDPTKEDRRLVAYVVFKPGCETGRVELVMHLRRDLPDFMIPAAFVRLQQMPLSASGKLDFAALPAPSDLNLLRSGPKEKPVTSIEQQLLDIIQDLLDGETIEINDNIFLVGGDSLLGMQLIIELKDKFKLELRFDQIFEAATISDLAHLIEEMQKGKHPKQIQDDVFAGRRVELPEQIGETHIQGEESGAAQGLKEFRLPNGVISLQKTMSSKPIFWSHYLNANLYKALGQDRPVTFLVLTPEDIDALGKQPTLNSIAARFVKKIVMTQPHGPYAIGGYCIGAVLAYEIAVQLRREGYVVALLMMVDPPGPSSFKMRNPLGARLSNPCYAVRRIMKLGPRGCWLKISERVAERLRQFGLGAPKAELYQGQKLIEVAASTYHAETYGGTALLLLAADHAPHVNFLAEWQALIPDDLHFEYISGHHSEMMNQPQQRCIADAITAHLECVSQALPEPSVSPDIVSTLSSEDDPDYVGVQSVDTAEGNLYQKYRRNEIPPDK